MIPHLQHRALQHIARHNRPPQWANARERRFLVARGLAKPTTGDRWQLTELGWQGAGDVRTLQPIGPGNGPDAA